MWVFVMEIKGVVVKLNKKDMGKNWIHIQDGTDSNGDYRYDVIMEDAVLVNKKSAVTPI